MGWKEPRYVFFCTRPKSNQGARYLLLRARPDSRRKRKNGSIFEGYLCDLQESISNMWRITPEAVARYGNIANFRATWHTMWIHVCKDLDKQWIQMHYCITEGDINMVIKEWDDEWRILAITQDLPKRTAEEQAGHGETQP
jgi:hypothetical protein